MPAIFVQMPLNYTEVELRRWLKERGIVHVRNSEHLEKTFKVGDALKCKKDGKVARILSKSRDREDHETFLIANKNMSKEELKEVFDTPMEIEAN